MIPSEMWMRENPGPSQGKSSKRFPIDVLEKVLECIPQPKGEKVNLYVQAILDGDWDYSKLTKQAGDFVHLNGSLIIPQGILTRPFAVTSNSVVLDIYKTDIERLSVYNEQFTSQNLFDDQDADIENPPRLSLENAVWEDYINNCRIELTAYGVGIAKTCMEQYHKKDSFPKYVDDVLSEVSRAKLLFKKILKNFGE